MTPQTWCDIFRMSRCSFWFARRSRVSMPGRGSIAAWRSHGGPLLLSGRDDRPGLRGRFRGRGDAALRAAAAAEIAFEVCDERGDGCGAGIAGDALGDRVDL